MDWSTISLYPLASTLVLVLARTAMLVQLVPFLGGKAAPQSVKLSIALTITVFLVPSMPAPPSVEGAMLGLLIVKEAIVGLTLGFVTALLFDSLRVAGQIIDTTRGQNMATALVPQLPNRVSLTSNIAYQLAIAIFLVAGGHIVFIEVITRSYDVVPLFEFPSAVTSIEQALFIVRLFGDSMLFATSLCLPAIAALLCSDLVLAFVNKAAPQVQVFFLGMPLKSLLGIFIVALTLGVGLLDHWLPGVFEILETLVVMLGAGA